jgi:hypothetical protein
MFLICRVTFQELTLTCTVFSLIRFQVTCGKVLPQTQSVPREDTCFLEYRQAMLQASRTVYCCQRKQIRSNVELLWAIRSMRNWWLSQESRTLLNSINILWISYTILYTYHISIHTYLKPPISLALLVGVWWRVPDIPSSCLRSLHCPQRREAQGQSRAEATWYDVIRNKGDWSCGYASMSNTAIPKNPKSGSMMVTMPTKAVLFISGCELFSVRNQFTIRISLCEIIVF